MTKTDILSLSFGELSDWLAEAEIPGKADFSLASQPKGNGFFRNDGFVTVASHKII